MASYVADYTLNLAADEATARTITVRIHTGAPGNSGANNQVSGASVDVAASGWSTAASGISETSADTEFGVLSTSASNTITAYSLFDGNNFMGWADLDASVTVAANESFTIDGGTIEFNFARP